jgi:hypothetical protein
VSELTFNRVAEATPFCIEYGCQCAAVVNAAANMEYERDEAREQLREAQERAERAEALICDFVRWYDTGQHIAGLEDMVENMRPLTGQPAQEQEKESE